MSDAFTRLQELLRELFQFDNKDLDFGIYRIMNHKRDAVEEFIQNGLAGAVDDALKGGAVARQEARAKELRQATEQVKETFGEYAIDPKGELNESFRETPLGKDYLEARSGAGEAVDLEELKATIFNHVYTFFGRYYDNGDFLSKRRYSRRQKYAIPYNGEEVYLHWANADQYYIKTGEHFTDYRYKAPDGVTVHFELTNADTEQNNVKGEPVSLLEHHLRRYTRRNTSDFFVHKDLEGFLKGELDFYLKNEVLDVDDLDAWGPDRSESWFEVMRAVKGVGRSIIAFLAQIEDFQKRLFEKKKLVVNAGYCLTLDRVPEELYEEVAACDAQREEWVRLFTIDEIEENITTPGYTKPLTVDFLKANPHLVLDTKHFGEDFKDRLLAGIEDLDAQLDGLLVESENFQALNLLQERYREQVKCIYIDPPYNTGGDGFLYKDSYQHSSWMTMMEGRVRASREVLSDNGVIFASIDEHELHNLRILFGSLFEEENFVGDFVWQSKKGGGGDVGTVVTDHEYIPCFRKTNDPYALSKLPVEAEQLDLTDEKGKYRRGRELNKWGAGSRREDRPTMYFPIPGPDGEDVYPFRNDGAEGRWRWGKKRMLEIVKHGDVDFVKRSNGTYIAYEKIRSADPRLKPYRTWLTDVKTTADGSKTVREIFGGKAYDFPKPVELLKHLISIGINDNEQLVFDFFAGSGTTGHAVIDLNREDGGDRRYVLVEMGEYFDTVLKPRILKVIYSKDWKDGKPVSREGTSHALKYLKLESYEDTLDNIAFTHEKQGQDALELYGDDYRLRYMLDFETRGSASLLNVEKLTAPFRYELRLQNGGETRETSVDLPETFAYLLGLRVRTRKAHHDGDRRYLVYRGATPERGEVAVIWRDTEGWAEEDYKRDERFVREEELTDGADEVFVNGDSFIAEARPLEGVFKERMLVEPVRG